ncbi:MAG: hypothetical protein JNG90_12175 [Planctomycetaceae bacterium]|nr:hypothetical protein [Planctomycetaceae bacterium]
MAILLRTIGAIALAMIVGFALVVGVELFSEVVHPFPAGVEKTEAEICRHVERYPAWVLAVAAPMWGATALASTWVAGRLGNRGAALFVGLLLFAALALNLSMLPYPIWFKAACLILIPLAVAAGVAWSKGRGPTAVATATAPPIT